MSTVAPHPPVSGALTSTPASLPMPSGSRRITLEEFLALPDDGVERWVIRGQLREKRDSDMTRRNRTHSITEGRITRILGKWLDQQPEPRGEIVCGEAGFLLRRNEATVTAGVDVALITAAQADSLTASTTLIEGPPLLIAEVLSPSDTLEEVTERVEEYLACGVPLIWVLNPYFKTLTVHRPGMDVAALSPTDTLSAYPQLPGFQARVSDFFR
ncbi:MAG: Uma2 family endonuclease [Bacteroidales bacterium]|nr:Uma2 family endonuclease [Bacteroidales bacterium]